jgi:hypothetical protein
MQLVPRGPLLLRQLLRPSLHQNDADMPQQAPDLLQEGLVEVVDMLLLTCWLHPIPLVLQHRPDHEQLRAKLSMALHHLSYPGANEGLAHELLGTTIWKKCNGVPLRLWRRR